MGDASVPRKGGRWGVQLLALACLVALLIALNSASLRSGQAKIVNRLASVAGPALDSTHLADVHGEQPSPRRASETSPYGSASSLLDAISRPATTRGPVKKEGMLDLRNWHVKRSRARQDALDAWRERRMQLESEARALQEEQAGSSSTGALPHGAPPLPPPPLFPGCHVFVNHRYKFIYVRHPKAASTSLLSFFGKCVNGSSPYNSTCIEPLFTQPVPDEEAESLWRDYFVFTFVRNPFDRAVSSYKMMMEVLLWEPVPPGESWRGSSTGGGNSSTGSGSTGGGSDAAGKAGAAAAAGGAGAQQQQQQRYRHVLPAAREYGWEDFCADPVSAERLCVQDKKCSGKGRAFVQLHLQAQAPCLLAPAGGWAVDFIGAVERIDEDLNSLLDLLDARRGEGLPPLPRRQAGKLPNINGRACITDASLSPRAEPPEPYCQREEYFSGRHASCLQRIRDYYPLDVDRLFS